MNNIIYIYKTFYLLLIVQINLYVSEKIIGYVIYDTKSRIKINTSEFC